jgi:hypothetical protein
MDLRTDRQPDLKTEAKRARKLTNDPSPKSKEYAASGGNAEACKGCVLEMVAGLPGVAGKQKGCGLRLAVASKFRRNVRLPGMWPSTLPWRTSDRQYRGTRWRRMTG